MEVGSSAEVGSFYSNSFVEVDSSMEVDSFVEVDSSMEVKY